MTDHEYVVILAQESGEDPVSVAKEAGLDLVVPLPEDHPARAMVSIMAKEARRAQAKAAQEASVQKAQAIWAGQAKAKVQTAPRKADPKAQMKSLKAAFTAGLRAKGLDGLSSKERAAWVLYTRIAQLGAVEGGRVRKIVYGS